MPKQKNNIVMKTTRGMFGKQVVFKERAGESYVSAPPQVSEDRKPTDSQQVIQQKFKTSTKYASAAIKDEATKKAYQKAAKRGRSAQNVAVQDAFNPPVVSGLITQTYKGVVGDAIIAEATDDFQVKGVKVSIHNSANELIEEGAATLNPGGLTWTYTVTQANANVAGTKIKATATDLPGNEGSLEVTL